MREKWLQKRRQDLLPVAYHHIVFTLPHEFNALIRAYPKVIYRCLFHSVWSTLKAFANERHHLSGQLGALMVLHTWGRNLSQHVHLHCLVPSGVLTKEHQWLATRKAAYLFPVKALSVRFKKVMLSSVRGEVTTHHDLLIKTAQKSWVVYSKPVLNKTETVINYLSKYCNRIGLNPDQLHHDNNKLRLDYKDYRTAGSTSLVCSAGEILRRLLLHVLLKGLMRIRYYGFMANAVRVKLVKLIWASLQAHPLIADKVIEKLPPTCPSCGFAEMVMTRINLRPDAFSSA